MDTYSYNFFLLKVVIFNINFFIQNCNLFVEIQKSLKKNYVTLNGKTLTLNEEVINFYVFILCKIYIHLQFLFTKFYIKNYDFYIKFSS